MAALSAAALLAYAVLSWELMAHAPRHPWTVAALFGPLVLALAAAGWQRRQAPVLAAAGGLAALLAGVALRGGVGDVQRLYVLQHAAIHLALGGAFAFTLRPGATPLVTLLAERVHLNFTPPMRAYTRRLTAAWAGYFVLMVLASLLIYASAPWPWWSFFCTLLTPASALAFFVGEHLWRYRRHPDFERASMATAWQAYRRHGAPGAPR